MKRRLTALTIAGALLVAACGESTSDTTAPQPIDGTTAPTDGTTTPADGTTTGQVGSGAVSASESELGTILTNADGFTLYVFTQDTEGESTCYDECADLWPPVPGGAFISDDLDAAMFGETARTDGSSQLTVNGQPLYLYTPDTSPGDVTGQGFSDVWFVVDTNGVMIGGPESAAGAATTQSGNDDTGYGYGG